MKLAFSLWAAQFMTFLTFASISLFVNMILAYLSSKTGKISCPLYLFRLGCLFFFFLRIFGLLVMILCVCVYLELYSLLIVE